MIRRNILRKNGKRCYAAQHTYQKTLNLPKTTFPKRSNLEETFKNLIPQSSEVVYQEQLSAFRRKVMEFQHETKKLNFIKEKLFILHDGPPYANGNLHLGHALNKILKDIINRYQLSRGKYVYYKPGWDCHGLPIELKALKDINGKKIDSISPMKIRSIAKSHAQKAVDEQKQQFKEFGIMADWKDCYKTMDPQYELNQLRVFQKMFRSGLIKRQNKPVYWGPETRTALAEGELEYKENHKSIAVYAKFPLTSESNLKLLEKLPKLAMVEFFVKQEANRSISCLIWTTTPWTLVANRAVCFNRKLTYCLLQFKHDNMIVAKDQIEQLNLTEPYRILSEFSGSLLEELEYTNPLLKDGIPRPLLHGDHVTSSAGTGLVHTAPGHGSDDYLISLKNNLEIFSPVDHTGRYKLDELPKHLTSFLSRNNTPLKVTDEDTAVVIINMLRDFDMLHDTHEYIHSYPYDWRSKTPVIIRSTPQWFADLHEVKGLALTGINEVKFNPERGKKRLSSFIENRNEWCISRQRSWGVPIPAFHKKGELEATLMTNDTLEHVIKVIERKGIDAWFSDDQSDMKEWLPHSLKDRSGEFVRGRDTMDVWFDSGTSWNVIKDFYKNLSSTYYPTENLADVYLEGSDQHRGWFQSSLLTKVANDGAPYSPYKQVITHGFTLDENGLKMSKSIGNTISPSAVIRGEKNMGLPALGVDGLRYLVAQADFTTDVVAGKTVIKHVADSLKKFRLTFRYLLGNLSQESDALLPVDQLRPIDKYMLLHLQRLLNQSQLHYDEFDFSKILTTMQYHMTNELSAFYFDISKDTLYSNRKHSLKRRQIQTILYHVYDTYRAIMMPLLPIMIQETWNHIPAKYKGDYKSPFFKPWPHYEIDEEPINKFKDNELSILAAFKVKMKELDEGVNDPSRTITTIHTDSDNFLFDIEELRDILQTAELRVELNSTLPRCGNNIKLFDGSKVLVTVEESNLAKCPRCWKYNSLYEDHLCTRCDEAIKIPDSL